MSGHFRFFAQTSPYPAFPWQIETGESGERNMACSVKRSDGFNFSVGSLRFFKFLPQTRSLAKTTLNLSDFASFGKWASDNNFIFQCDLTVLISSQFECCGILYCSLQTACIESVSFFKHCHKGFHNLKSIVKTSWRTIFQSMESLKTDL